MKYILLLRHAKSSWDDSSLKDFDRPLARRGIHDAPMMGQFIRQINYLPDAVISSPAQRAKETAELFAEGAEMNKKLIAWNEDLYYGSYEDYIEVINQADDAVEILMLVGHNPKMEEATGELCGNSGISPLRMPTAAVACFEHPAEKWLNVRPGSARLKWMMIPKVVKKIKGFG